jgi:hypothetical protein
MVATPKTNFEAGHMRATYSFMIDLNRYSVHDADDLPPLSRMLPCPACARLSDFAGIFDGHVLRVCCRCGEQWEPELETAQIDVLVKDFDGKSLRWFPDFAPEGGSSEVVQAAVDEIHDKGTREGWYPSISGSEEALLVELMRTGCAARALGEQEARQHADKLNYVMSTAGEINRAWKRHRDTVRAQRRVDRGFGRPSPGSVLGSGDQ